MSRRRGEQGRVTLKVVVNVNGEAEKVQIDQSSGFELLDKAALSAVKNWKFIPAKSNHQPVVGAVIVPVRFTLDS
jgi:protein TonB